MKRLLNIVCMVSALGGLVGVTHTAEDAVGDVATSLEAVRSVSDRVRMIERRLSDLILTSHGTRVSWALQDIERLVVQVRAVMLGACGEYGDQYRVRCCEALNCAQQVLPRLLVKIEATLTALKEKQQKFPSEGLDSFIRGTKEHEAVVRRLRRLYDVLKQECKALEYAVQHCKRPDSAECCINR